MPGPNIEIDPKLKADVTERLREYLLDELDIEIGQFDGEFLFDFLAREVAPVFYNAGLLDARAMLASRVDQISEAIEELERPVTRPR